MECWIAMLNELLFRLRALFRRDEVEAEMDEELRSHFENQVEKLVASGLPRDEATRRARLQFGGYEQLKEECRDARGVNFIETLLRDVRFGFRAMKRSPGLTLVAILSLALGIGANTAMFSLLNTLLLKSLPVQEPSKLVLFGAGSWGGSQDTLPDRSWELFSYPFYREISKQNAVYAGVTAVHSVEFSTHGGVDGGSAELLKADLVSGTFFSVLGVKPLLGRVLNEADDRTPGAAPVAVASYSWWKRRFGMNPSVLGKTFRFESTVYTIVGVAPQGFFGTSVGQQPDLWIPLSMEKEISPGWNGLNDKFFQSLYIIARLKPGVTVEQASADTNFLFKQILRSEYVSAQPAPKELAAIQHARIDLTSAARGLSNLRIQYSLSLEILMAVSGLVLLIACANIANLLLARGTARSREFAVRAALGASRLRLSLQLVTESFLFALFGAGLGVALAWRAGDFLLGMATGSTGHAPLSVTPDLRVLLFSLLLTLFTVVLFGMAPAIRSTQFQLTSSLKDGRGAAPAQAKSPLSRALLVLQIALSLVLLAGAGLFLRTLLNFAHVDTGFEKQNVLVFQLDEYAAGYEPDARLGNLLNQIEERVGAVRGVRAASFSLFTFNQGEWSNDVTLEGISRNSENSEEVLMNRVGAGYFAAFGLPVLFGRTFTLQDNERGPKVAVINETMARRFFPGESPIGRHFGFGDDPTHSGDYEIIGIVKNAKYESLRERQHPAAYFPHSQNVTYLPNLEVRFSGDAAQITPQVRQAIEEVTRDVPIGEVSTLEEEVDNSVSKYRLVAQLSAFFGLLAVFLVCIGIYGLFSYTVARRTNEIGIRMALGAKPSEIMEMVLREGALLTFLGLMIGLSVSLGLTRLLSSFLFGVRPNDPLTFALATIFLILVSLMACYMPARRATRVDPIVALRYE
jgi:predicted permease